MPKGIPNVKPSATDDALEPFGGKGDHDGDGKVGGSAPAEGEEGFALYEAVPAVKMVSMELLRNYRPAGVFEIVGYVRPAVVRKDGAGREYEAEAAQFIAGEMAPPPQAGVGTQGKIWAGTILRVPQDEGRIMRTNNIAERSVDD